VRSPGKCVLPGGRKKFFVTHYNLREVSDELAAASKVLGGRLSPRHETEAATESSRRILANEAKGATNRAKVRRRRHDWLAVVQPEAKANFKAEMRATESHQNQSGGAIRTLVEFRPWMVSVGLLWPLKRRADENFPQQ